MTGYDVLEDPDFTTWIVWAGEVYGNVPFENYAEALDYAERYQSHAWPERLRKSGKGKP